MSNAKEADARADVYGLGMTALFSLYGKELPALVTRKPERVIAGLACSDAVKAVVTRAIELEPEQRYAGARAFGEALRAAALPALPPPAPQARAGSPLPIPNATPVAPASVAEVPVQAPHLHAPYAVELARKEQQAVDREAAKVVPTRAGRSPAKVATAVVGAVATALGVATMVREAVKPSGKVPGAAGSAMAVPVSATVSAPATPGAELPTVVTAGARPCAEGMVPVPAGTFTMGSADGDSDEKPPHKVKLSAFCIDKTEVTVAAYRQCTRDRHSALQCTVPNAGGFCNWDKTGRDTHPINCVDWTQAGAYCRWTGGYLPSEAQWEYAARGTEGRKYPWGEELPGPSLLNVCGSECAAAHPGWSTMYAGNDKWPETAPVGTYPAGESPFGALDMAGNVWEWVADWYAPYPAEGKTIPEDPKGPDKSPESRRVIRGGGWYSDDASGVRAVCRSGYDVSVRGNYVGFRCARGQKL
jgi:formylglycine-generating enzyme required for sulfatase activity